MAVRMGASCMNKESQQHSMEEKGGNKSMMERDIEHTIKVTRSLLGKF